MGDLDAIFSTPDLQSGFSQVELGELSRPYTVFTTNLIQFMFTRMAQGLRDSPLTFQRLMNSVLSELLGKHVFLLLDDVTIASKENFQEHFHLSFHPRTLYPLQTLYQSLRIAPPHLVPAHRRGHNQ